MAKKSGGTVSSSINNINYSQQQTAFKVQFLGQSTFPNNSTGLGPLQTTLLDLYTRYWTSKGQKKMLSGSLVLGNNGLQVTKLTGENDFYPMPNVSTCMAVSFVGSKTKMKGTKTYGYVFDNIKQNQPQPAQQQPQTWILRKDQKYLLKMKHSPLVVCVLRRDSGLKTLDVHAFVCESNDQALSISYSIEMAKRIHADQVKQESQVFKYDPYSMNNNVAVEKRNEGGNHVYKNENNNNLMMPRNAMVRQTFSPSSTREADLPEVIEMLGVLGAGKGSVINPVIKTTNINLINNMDFYNKPSNNNKSTVNENRVFLLNQNDVTKPQQAKPRQNKQQKPTRSASMHFLNDMTSYAEDITFDDLVNNKKYNHNYQNLGNNINDRNTKPQLNPIQLSRSRSFKDENIMMQQVKQNLPRKASTPDNDNRRVTMFTNMNNSGGNSHSNSSSNNSSNNNLSPNAAVNLNPLGDKPTKPVAMVQPRKLQGVKVFPAGNDRTLLIPEKSKFLKKYNKNTSSQPPVDPPQQQQQLQKQGVTKRDSTGLYAAISKVNRDDNNKNSNSNPKNSSSSNLNVSSSNLNKLTPNLQRNETKSFKDQFVLKTTSENQLKKQSALLDFSKENGSGGSGGKNGFGGGGSKDEELAIWVEQLSFDSTMAKTLSPHGTNFEKCNGYYP